MDSATKKENLFRDRVHYLANSMLSGVVASFILSVVLVLVLGRTVDRGLLMLWMAGMVFVCMVRLLLLSYYRRIKKDGDGLRRFLILFLVGLAITGVLWGSTAFFPLSNDLLFHRVFITLLIGGLVAGTVGIYSAIMYAFFIFSIPVMIPIVLVFFLAGDPFFYAMGAMTVLFWVIMMLTAQKFNRDITGHILTKYQNLDLISDLEAEMKVRRAAEEDLKKKNLEIEGIVARRTEELLASNQKLIREIEERRLISTALEENEEKFRDMVETINDVIYSTDDKGVINYVSPVARRVLGYRPEELVGENLRDYVHKDDRKMFTDLLPKRMAGDARLVEYRLRTKTGEFLWIGSSSRGIFRNGEFVGLRGVLADISEKRKLEEQFRRTHKMEAVATLSGGIAHDFNNLLAVILGNTELTMMNPDVGPGVHPYLKKIIDSSLKAKDIVKELLSFAHQSNVERKPINIAAAVSEEIRRLESTLPFSVSLATSISDDIGTTLGDDVRVGQVVANLWDNAVEAMSEGGGELSITVKAVLLTEDDIDFDPDMAPGRYIQLSVRDTGTGIHPENIGRLFDPYYTTKAFGAGDGLGLAVAHGIVKRHGGGIRVTSVPEEGACFDVFFSADESKMDTGTPVTLHSR